MDEPPSYTLQTSTNWILAALTAVILIEIAPHPAEAIPAFARKYQTSCQTCHMAFPKLNPFGEAFRLLGYHMPAETEDLIKELPVPLGAPAYKRVWPDAVWPSDIPGTVPLSLNTVFSDLTERTAEDGVTETIRNDFRFPQEFSMLSGGTLGETLSFFGELAFAPEVDEGQSGIEIELEHSQLNFNGPFGSGAAFNLKVGRLMPEVAQPFGHGALLTTEGPSSVLAYQPIGVDGGADVGGEHGAGIAVPHSVDGIEAYGILGHRFLYSGGIANGLGPGTSSVDGNNAKDVFGSLAYKIGGLALDGDGYVPSDQNWREKSVRVGFFAYRGDGTDVFFSAGGHDEEEPVPAGDLVLEDRTFTRVGFDANLIYQDLNVITGYVRGRDTLAEYGRDVEALLLNEEGDFIYHTWFAEGDYVIYPWLQGAVRYEWLRPAREGAPDFKRIVPNLTALVRANVKAYVELERNLGENDDYTLLGAIRFAF